MRRRRPPGATPMLGGGPPQRSLPPPLCPECGAAAKIAPGSARVGTPTIAACSQCGITFQATLTWQLPERATAEAALKPQDNDCDDGTRKAVAAMINVLEGHAHFHPQDRIKGCVVCQAIMKGEAVLQQL